jgi:cobalamin biosynthesis Co2+ chelatase CbiK
MVLTEKELVAKVIAEWKKMYPKAKLSKLKLKAYKDAISESDVLEILSETFYEDIASEGQKLARKMFKGKISPDLLENVEDSVWEELVNGPLSDVTVTLR